MKWRVSTSVQIGCSLSVRQLRYEDIEDTSVEDIGALGVEWCTDETFSFWFLEEFPKIRERKCLFTVSEVGVTDATNQINW